MVLGLTLSGLSTISSAEVQPSSVGTLQKEVLYEELINKGVEITTTTPLFNIIFDFGMEVEHYLCFLSQRTKKHLQQQIFLNFGLHCLRFLHSKQSHSCLKSLWHQLIFINLLSFKTYIILCFFLFYACSLIYFFNLE